MDQSARYDARNPPALRLLVAGGAQLRAWPREVLQAAWREAHALHEETAARNPQFRKAWDSYKPWRNEQFQWFRVADNAYDNLAFTATAPGRFMALFPFLGPSKAGERENGHADLHRVR
ncbi:hypothetical protein GCM10009416_36880 [Craurococcus roseus]|uniref:Uncharacterized protein n=1 Tax=Craurococcus roseus TaxID=77585 RepID=A0ABN1FPN9_9PROT